MDTPFIQPTPILYGEAARRFERIIQEGRKESPEERENRLRRFKACMAMYEEGKKIKLKTQDDD